MKVIILNKNFAPNSAYDKFTPEFSIDNGMMKVSELKKCPENEFYYTEQNKLDIKNLEMDFRKILDSGIICPNHDPIHVCPKTKIIWSGHNRLQAAIQAGAKYVYVKYAHYVYDKNDLNESQIKEILQDYNKLKRNEQGLHNLYLKILSLKVDGKVNKKKREKFAKDWNVDSRDVNTLLRIDTISDLRKRQRVIRNLDKSIALFKDLSKEIASAKKKNPKKPKKIFPWIRYNLKHPSHLLDSLKETDRKMNIEMSLTDSRTKKEHKKHWGQKAITPLVSHTVNDSHCTTMRLHGGIGINCEMESAPLNSDDKKEQYDFDLYFPMLKKHGFDYEVEIKAKSDKTEKNCFVFGPGGSRIETPKPYIFVQYNKEMTTYYMIFAMITGKDVKSGGLDINKYLKNHKENVDYILVHGKINENTNEITGETL